MKKYLVDVNVEEIHRPTYQRKDPYFYRFSNIWQYERGLNESQCQALRAALTNELVIIQGPPGKKLRNNRKISMNFQSILLIIITQELENRTLDCV